MNQGQWGRVKRLDALYAKIGRAAQNLEVPVSLSASQQMARAAASELSEAHAALEKAEKTTEASLHDPAAFRRKAGISRATATVQQARLRADFACVAFGRACVDQQFTPPGMGEAIHEIGQLRSNVDQLP